MPRPSLVLLLASLRGWRTSQWSGRSVMLFVAIGRLSRITRESSNSTSTWASTPVGASSTQVIFCSKIRRERQIRTLVPTFITVIARKVIKWTLIWPMEPPGMTDSRKNQREGNTPLTSSRARVIHSTISRRKSSLMNSEIGKIISLREAVGFSRQWANSSGNWEIWLNFTRTMNLISWSRCSKFLRRTNTIWSWGSKTHLMKCGLSWFLSWSLVLWKRVKSSEYDL